jgi:hypothetical protein
MQIILKTVLVEAQNTNFSSSYFNTSDSFLVVDEVQYYVGNHLFPDEGECSKGSCGRLLYKERVKMKDSASGVVASPPSLFNSLLQNSLQLTMEIHLEVDWLSHLPQIR